MAVHLHRCHIMLLILIFIRMTTPLHQGHTCKLCFYGRGWHLSCYRTYLLWYTPVPMASVAVLELLLISVVIFGAVTWSDTATIVPCKPPSNILVVKGDKIGKCGFLIPNNTIQQQLRWDWRNILLFSFYKHYIIAKAQTIARTIVWHGSFKGTKQGQPFRDFCKPNVTIDKIEITTGQSPVMIRSLKTTYRYYQECMHFTSDSQYKQCLIIHC